MGFASASEAIQLSIAAMMALSASWLVCQRGRYELKGVVASAAERALSLLGQVSCTTSFQAMQASLLWSYHLHNHNQRDAAWNVLGIAIRVACGLGIHHHGVEASTKSHTDLEMMKLAFWTMYSYERFLNASLGRPTALNDDDINTQLPSYSMTEVSLHTPLNYIQYDVQLSRILGQVNQSLYRLGSAPQTVDMEALLEGEHAYVFGPS